MQTLDHCFCVFIVLYHVHLFYHVQYYIVTIIYFRGKDVKLCQIWDRAHIVVQFFVYVKMDDHHLSPVDSCKHDQERVLC